MNPAAPPTKAALILRDPVLLSVCRAELSAIGISECNVVSSADRLSEVDDCAPILIDLDDNLCVSLISPASLSESVIGITRQETHVPTALREACRAILHRPFPLERFRAEVLCTISTPGRPTDSDSPSARPPKRIRSKLRKSPPIASPPGKELIPSKTGTAILYGDTEIPLTPGEATVFLALFRASGSPVSREELSFLLHSAPESNLPDVHVCSIRKKLTPYGMETRIHTVRKQGYRLL